MEHCRCDRKELRFRAKSFPVAKLRITKRKCREPALVRSQRKLSVGLAAARFCGPQGSARALCHKRTDGRGNVVPIGEVNWSRNPGGAIRWALFVIARRPELPTPRTSEPDIGGTTGRLRFNREDRISRDLIRTVEPPLLYLKGGLLP